MNKARTLFEKLWEAHVVRAAVQPDQVLPHEVGVALGRGEEMTAEMLVEVDQQHAGHKDGR